MAECFRSRRDRAYFILFTVLSCIIQGKAIVIYLLNTRRFLRTRIHDNLAYCTWDIWIQRPSTWVKCWFDTDTRTLAWQLSTGFTLLPINEVFGLNEALFTRACYTFCLLQIEKNKFRRLHILQQNSGSYWPAKPKAKTRAEDWPTDLFTQSLAYNFINQRNKSPKCTIIIYPRILC